MCTTIFITTVPQIHRTKVLIILLIHNFSLVRILINHLFFILIIVLLFLSEINMMIEKQSSIRCYCPCSRLNLARKDDLFYGASPSCF